MIRKIISECLALNEEDIDIENTLNELGAESIDILDLEFRIKKQMNVDLGDFLVPDTKIKDIIDFCNQKGK